MKLDDTVGAQNPCKCRQFFLARLNLKLPITPKPKPGTSKHSNLRYIPLRIGSKKGNSASCFLFTRGVRWKRFLEPNWTFGTEHEGHCSLVLVTKGMDVASDDFYICDVGHLQFGTVSTFSPPAAGPAMKLVEPRQLCACTLHKGAMGNTAILSHTATFWGPPQYLGQLAAIHPSAHRFQKHPN